MATAAGGKGKAVVNNGTSDELGLALSNTPDSSSSTLKQIEPPACVRAFR